MSEIRKHKDLKVFQLSFEAGLEIFELTKKFPKEERDEELEARSWRLEGR